MEFQAFIEAYGFPAFVVFALIVMQYHQSRANAKRSVLEAEADTQTRLQMNGIASELKRENTILRQELSDLRTQFADLSGRHAVASSSFESITQSLRAQLSLTESLLTERTDKERLLIDRIEALTEENKATNALLDQQRAKIASLESAVSIAAELRSRVATENQALIKQNRNLEQRIDALEAENAQLKTEIEAANKRISELEATKPKPADTKPLTELQAIKKERPKNEKNA